jgi:hypothetical protein
MSSYNFNAPPGYAHPQGLESRNPWLKSSYNFNAPPEHAHPHGLKSRNPSLESSYNFNAPPEHTHNGASLVSPSLTSITDEPESETLRKLRSFKQFDTVVDTSDHYFVNNNSSMQQVSLLFVFVLNSFNDVLCFSSNLNYMGLQITNVLSRIQKFGLKKSRMSGRF